MTDDARHSEPERSMPTEYLRKWQNIATILATVFKARAALIMLARADEVEVVARSETAGNPFKVGDRQKFTGAVYCEAALETDGIAYIDDATKYERWKNGPAMKPGLTSYLGVPLKWPDGDSFGTICVMDSSPLPHTGVFASVLLSFKEVIEDQLRLLLTIEAQVSLERTLHEQAQELETARKTALQLFEEADKRKSEVELLLSQLEAYRDRLESLVEERTSSARAEQERATRYFDFMAHDIANIITPAVAYSEMTLAESSSLGPSRRHLERVAVQLRKATRFVLNVRWLDEVATNRELEYSQAALPEMIKGIAGIISKESSREIRIVMECQNESVLLRGTKYVRPILEGVIRNATDHVEGDEVVLEIDVRIENGNVSDGPCMCRIEISDHGSGIDDDAKELLNTPLDLTKRYTRGVASDISLYKAILNQFGGDLVISDRVEGDFTHGTRVVVVVPCKIKTDGPSGDGAQDGVATR